MNRIMSVVLMQIEANALFHYVTEIQSNEYSLGNAKKRQNIVA